MTTTRKSPARVCCIDCRFFDFEDVLGICPVGNRPPVIDDWLICQRYKPIRRRTPTGPKPRLSPAPRQASQRPLEQTDLDQLRARIAAAGLLWAVAEIRLIDGQLAISHTRSAELEDIRAVAQCLKVL
ncbi:hypothetical protein [uncultured Thiocystis sp.]|jgi:hypothetical protein|uniref:hypothetical protein n=1 Tax=uncultured Thiocystis sp. TaxID=1202134 RepID=UPI0025D3832C|nr:hypothetical protein [uncultured Thiocystis sp.]